MPRKSERSKLLDELYMIIKVMVMFDEDETEEFEEIVGIMDGVLNCRYLNPRTVIPKCSELSELILLYPEREFRQMVRMDKDSFLRLTDKLATHPVFRNNSHNSQTPVWKQLFIAFSRLGCEGNGASVGRHAALGGVSYGSVHIFTQRVIAALISFKDEVIKWPNVQERRAISKRFEDKHGLPGAVGIVDGTPVHFAQRPAVDGEVFWTRKQRYSMNVQLVCDDRKKIIYYQLGWPGTVYDSTVFDRSALRAHPDTFFDRGEYLLGDSGYALSDHMVTPYRQPAASLPVNKVYNELFSSARVIIEHVNGILKGRFSSLKGVRVQIKERKDFEYFNHWIHLK